MNEDNVLTRKLVRPWAGTKEYITHNIFVISKVCYLCRTERNKDGKLSLWRHVKFKSF